MTKIKDKSYEGIYTYVSKKLVNGKPDICFYAGYKIDGKRIEKKLGYASEGWDRHKAKDARTTLIALAKLQHKQSQDYSRTFDCAFELWMDKHVFGNQLQDPKTYRNDYNKHVKEHIGGKDICSITKHDIELIVSTMQRSNLSYAYIKKVLAIVSSVFTYQIKHNNFTQLNPVKLVSLRGKVNTRERVLTREEERQLLEYLHQRKHYSNGYIVTLLALDMGLRIGEIKRLRYEDVSLDNNTIHVVDSKHHASEFMLMTKRVRAEMIDIVRNKPDNKRLIFSADDCMLEKVQEPKAFKKAVKALKLNEGIQDKSKRIVFHSLRHTFCSKIASNAAFSPFQQMEIMRHKDIKTTQKYTHMNPHHERQRAASYLDTLNEESEDNK